MAIGIALGWLMAAALVTRAFEYGGLSGIAMTALLAWGSIAGLIEVRNAIASGSLTASAVIAQRLKDSRGGARAPQGAVACTTGEGGEQLLPDLAKECSAAVENPARTIMAAPRRAQIEMREHFGPI